MTNTEQLRLNLGTRDPKYGARKVNLLRFKLGMKAKQEPKFRFYSLKDRIVQQAAKLILEPIFESDFLECSYGFRPNRSAAGALEAIREGIQSGKRSVNDADLRGYFDSIPHDKLMKCLKMRIADRKMLSLIKMWLKCPIVEKNKGKTKKTYPKEGTPQDI